VLTLRGTGQEHRCEVAEKLGLTSIWELESAAMLLRIGMVTVPPSLAAKMQSIEPLTNREQEIAASIPEIRARLLEKVPRLSAVADIVRFQMKGFDGSGPPDVPTRKSEIPMGSRVIRALTDLQAEIRSGSAMDAAVEVLKTNIHLYDPQVIGALEAMVGNGGNPETAEASSKFFMASELKPGMILEADARSDADFPILVAETELTEMFIARLQNFAELRQLREPLIIVPSSIPAEE
jgi:hypothetical protein